MGNYREIGRIREALVSEPDWTQASFESALHTGRLFPGTRIPMNCIGSHRPARVRFSRDIPFKIKAGFGLGMEANQEMANCFRVPCISS